MTNPDHWLLAPLRPFRRLGMFGTWVLFILLFLGLRAIGQIMLARWLAIAYFIFCVYSWTVPWILRWWAGRRPS